MALTLSILVFAACEDDGLSVNFKQELKDLSFTLSKDSVEKYKGNNYTMVAPPVSTLTGKMEEYKEDLDKIESATLDSVTLTITAPDNQTFDFIEGFAIALRVKGGNEYKMAVITGLKGSEFQSSDKVIELKVLGENDVAEIIRSGQIWMEVEFFGLSAIDADVDIKVDMTYDVKMKL